MITESDIEQFLLPKLLEFRKRAHGYCAIQIEANGWHRSTDENEVRFRAYNEHAGHSVYAKTIDEAVSEVAAKCTGKTEAEMLRERAQEMLSRAAELDETR